jgi:hypothetical protein
MAASPAWKLYGPDKKYKACSHDVVLLAACIGILGDGATIRRDHSLIVWTEGVDGKAGESYDVVKKTCYDRWEAYNSASYRKIHGGL